MTKPLPEIDPHCYTPESEQLHYEPDRGPETLGGVILTVVFVAGVIVGVLPCKAW